MCKKALPRNDFKKQTAAAVGAARTKGSQNGRERTALGRLAALARWFQSRGMQAQLLKFKLAGIEGNRRSMNVRRPPPSASRAEGDQRKVEAPQISRSSRVRPATTFSLTTSDLAQ